MLGAHLKALFPGREVYGIERDPTRAAIAAGRLDRVFVQDFGHEDPPLEPGSVDTVLFGGLLSRVADPGAILRRYRAAAMERRSSSRSSSSSIRRRT